MAILWWDYDTINVAKNYWENILLSKRGVGKKFFFEKLLTKKNVFSKIIFTMNLLFFSSIFKRVKKRLSFRKEAEENNLGLSCFVG